MSAQQTVEAVSVPTQSVTLAAADLQAYIDALPRLRTEFLNIQVQEGHVPQTLKLENFYGPGILRIDGPNAGSGVLDDGIRVIDCFTPIIVNCFDVHGSSVETAVFVSRSTRTFMFNLTADGSHFNSGPTSTFGLTANYQSSVTVSNCAFSNLRIGMYCEGATMRICSCSGSGNAIGVVVETGGITLLTGTTPELMGGVSNGHWGGVIFDKNGELI